jgi:CBS domain-containing membrane protein
MKNFIKYLGIQKDTTAHKEKLISAVGGFLGIFLILHITNYFVPGIAGALIVASMGASAVLLFAVPHGPLSQPWPLIGGHVISAIIGVSVQMLVPDLFLAAALAVGISIGVMYYLRCIHPPGGASALAAVVSGHDVYALGFQYVLTPVFINACVIVLTAVLVNYFFPWRRYPAALACKEDPTPKPATGLGVIPRADLQYALKAMQSFSDISEDELEEIYRKAAQHKSDRDFKKSDIKLGFYYLHGKDADTGVVRRVIDESDDKNNDMVIYKIITGPDRQQTATTTREKFAKWAKHEVVFENNQWQIIKRKK